MPLFSVDTTRQDRPLAGLAFMMLSVVLFSLLNGISKWLVADIPVTEMVFFRHVFALPPTVWLLFRSGGLASLKTRRYGLHVIRMFGGLTGMSFGFWALALIPIADATAYSFAAPLLITALSVPILGERVGVHRWSAVAVGFVGVLIMVRPGSASIELGAIVALIGTVGSSVVALSMRQLGNTETPASIVVTYSAQAMLLSALALPFWWVTPDAWQIGGLMLVGAGGGVAQFWYTKALNLAPVAVISPLNYTGLIWAAWIGYEFWGEVPDHTTIGGALLIVMSSIYILYREAVRRAEKLQRS
jgi:drug/metabolite transporter (DMT)-like permease